MKTFKQWHVGVLAFDSGEPWLRDKGSLTAVEPRVEPTVPHLLSPECQEFVLAVNGVVYGVEPPIHDGMDEDSDLPLIPLSTRQAAADLIFSLARFIVEESNGQWEVPHVAANSDGRMSVAWTTSEGRVTVYVPPSEDGNYVIVTKAKGTPAQRFVDSKEHVERHVRTLLCDRNPL